MVDLFKIDYSPFDRPEILAFLFHPRSEDSMSSSTDDSEDILIPVEDDLVIGARIHHMDKAAPTILFFHGNGEIVSDYNDIGSLYGKIGINFFPVDYRGYGRSTGSPTVTGMMRDCHEIFKFVKQWLKDKGYTDPLIIMGRSLGSASALELAANYKDEIDGLIIESGFAFVIPLMKLIGINTDACNISEEIGMRNIEKIRSFDKPTLVIHAQYDHIIPFADGQALFDACPGPDKNLLKVHDADHNSVFFHGIEDYLRAVKDLALVANQKTKE